MITTTTIDENEIEILLETTPQRLRLNCIVPGVWKLHTYPSDAFLSRPDLEALRDSLNWILYHDELETRQESSIETKLTPDEYDRREIPNA